jgi:uncharacterized protein YjcR
MGQGPRIPKETWDAVKVAYLAGMTPKEIAQKFGLEEQTVSTKVCKAGWNKIIKEAIQSVTPTEDILAKTADILEMDWKAKGAGHRSVVFKIAHDALKSARLPTPRSWKDAQIADNMARKAVGLDEERGNSAVINVGFIHKTAGNAVTRIENDVVDAEFVAEVVRETGSD